MRTVAVFQYSWPITIHTINLVNVLAERSFKVHLFLYSCSTVYSNGDSISEAVQVHVVKIQHYNIVTRVIDRITRILFKKALFRTVISNNSITYATDKLKDSLPVSFIGIEKKGLAWAGFTHRSLKGKLFYYSLEIYEYNPGWFEEHDFEESRDLEIIFHKLAFGTIIQDWIRASALFKINDFPASKIIRLPVSVRSNSEMLQPRQID